MSQISVGTEPVQVAPRNSRRHYLSVQLLPNSIAAGNTGLVYGKFGSAPVPTLVSNTWDFVLNAGAQDGSNLYEASVESVVQDELWLCADTAAQQVNVVERSNPPAAPPPASGSAAL